MPNVYILQYFVVVQDDSSSAVQMCRAGLRIVTALGELSVPALTHAVAVN